ncbi:MAG: hypothetical protein NXI31_13455 [bacterium]|nr:hypothetical protein [bacterium]
MQTGSFCAALATAIATPFAAALAQAVPDQSVKHHLGIDSGYVENTNTSPAARGIPISIWSTVVSIPGSTSLRLSYSGVLLSGAHDRGSDGSYLKITSLTDSHHQMQHLVHVEQWRETSAYFNGDSVLVEIFAQPGTGENRLIIDSVSARTGDGEDSICFGTDHRSLSSDPRAARNQPGSCTSWLIDDCQHCLLTAGHCSSGLQVVQFNVPLSSGSGSLNHPSPSDQYAVDANSLQSNGGLGVGNDWAYFGVFPNSNTSLTPYQANGGQSYVLTQPSTSLGTLRITGYGTVSSPVSPTWNEVQKTHVGPLFSFSGTSVRYQIDTTSGNSGSPVIVDGTNQAIAIHANGGCNSSGGSNAGTGLNHPALQTALANPQGICDCPAIEFTYPNGLPTLVNHDGSTTFRVQIGGQQPLLAGSVRLHVDTGAGFQVLTPTQVGTNLFDVNFPAVTSCLTNISYYVSAQDTGSNTHTDPEQAPSAAHSAISGQSATSIRNYDFNTTPPGWSVINTNPLNGAWVRATPADSRGPLWDFDGSGQCWVTGNINNEDVDGGPTVLRTETFDLSTANDPYIRYALWFETTGTDVMEVQISENGGSTWTTVETLAANQGWRVHGFRALAYVTNLSQVVVRYSIADQPNNSVTEGAVDAFAIDDITCSATWSAFGAGCPGTNGIPSMTLASLPELGTNFALDVDNLGGGAALMVTGLGQQSVSMQPLGFGFAPNCLLLVTSEATDLLMQTAGMATWSMSIPNDPGIAGLRLYNQVVEITTQSAVSNAGDGEVQ